MNDDLNNIKNLFNLLANHHSLKEIVEEGSRILGNPLMLMDATMNLLAVCSDENIEDEIWNDFLAGNSRSKEYSDEKEVIHSMQQVMFGNEPILTQYQAHQMRRIVSKVACEGKILGYIVCLEHKMKFSENIFDLTKLVCDAFAVELQRSANRPIIEEDYKKVLRQILTDKKIYSHKFLSTLFDYEKGSFFMVSVPCNMTSESKLLYLQQHFEKLSPHSFAVDLRNEIAVLINTSTNKLDFLIRRYASILEIHNYKAGFSSAFSNIREIYDYYQQAKRAVSVGHFVDHRTIFYYPDIMVDDMLNTLAEYSDLKQYCSSALSLLQQYDKKYGTEYLKTIHMFLLCCGNITNMSKEMYTHRNTIVHRLKKIEEICDIDLNDHETRLKLALSIKIDRLLSRKEK